MKAGKLSESILKRSVLRQLHNSAVRAPGVGIDFGAVDASAGKQIVTAEACRAFDTFPEAGVYAALNNLVCSGAKPLGITMTLLLPTSASENDLRAWISAVSRVSEKEQGIICHSSRGAAGYGCDCDQMGRAGRNSDSCNGTPGRVIGQIRTAVS